MKSSDFEPEPPTWKDTEQARAARLVEHWRACTEPQRRTIERIADRLARLPKRPT